MPAALHVVMYHYVRDLPHTPFPRLKGMLTSAFRQQLQALQERYELASLETALAFLHGTYRPARDLCLLTFDDGLKEHYTEVTPVLAERGMQGVFFLITACVHEQQMASVHMNHVLMAALDFAEYQQAFFQRLGSLTSLAALTPRIDQQAAQHAYRWDTPDIAAFKYLFNFVLSADLRDQVVHSLFTDYIAPAASFAPSWYITWEEARAMQDAGMVLGGHSHQHQPLATLSPAGLARDVRTCQQLMQANLRPQRHWPFSYPYGQASTFNAQTVTHLRSLGITCAFCTEVGQNVPGSDLFALRRVDCNDVLASEASAGL
ncbi:MAG: polysaccharide deacetylase family protein [Candidatus Tectimicrobiota bacterium]